MMIVASSANAGGLGFRSALSQAQTIPVTAGGLIEDAEMKISFSEDFSEADLE